MMIEVTELKKQFRVAKRRDGVGAGIKDFFYPRFEQVVAVDELSFTIGKGELIGYLGPNGAGKSTTIKMLTGLLVPTAGHLLVNGRIPWKEREAHVARIGVVFGQRTTLWWDLPLIESLSLVRDIYRVENGRFQKNLTQFIDLLGLESFLNTPVRALSLGQRMRGDICAALLHDPDILFLDEPTIGLDVVAKERIRQFIQHLNQERGVTVILTTHDLADVARLCSRVLIIDHGKLLFDGGLQLLHERFAGKRELVVDFMEPYVDLQVEGAELIEQEGVRAVYQFEREKISASELIVQIADRYRIQDLTVREPDIESTIRRIYEEGLLG